MAENRVSNPNKPKIDAAKSNSGSVSVSGSTNRNGSANTGNDNNNKNGMNNKSNVIPKIIKIGSQKGENEKDKAKNNLSSKDSMSLNTSDIDLFEVRKLSIFALFLGCERYIPMKFILSFLVGEYTHMNQISNIKSINESLFFKSLQPYTIQK